MKNLFQLLATVLLITFTACSVQNELALETEIPKATEADFKPLTQDINDTAYTTPRLTDSTAIADSIAWAKAGY
jgi:hypothetical protein